MVALYLLDRSRRRQVVSTLRFWIGRAAAGGHARRQIQQPLSLILQLVSMALLLLAIAQLRFGTPAGSAARSCAAAGDLGMDGRARRPTARR